MSDRLVCRNTRRCLIHRWNTCDSMGQRTYGLLCFNTKAAMPNRPVAAASILPCHDNWETVWTECYILYVYITSRRLFRLVPTEVQHLSPGWVCTEHSDTAIRVAGMRPTSDTEHVYYIVCVSSHSITSTWIRYLEILLILRIEGAMRANSTAVVVTCSGGDGDNWVYLPSKSLHRQWTVLTSSPSSLFVVGTSAFHSSCSPVLWCSLYPPLHSSLCTPSFLLSLCCTPFYFI